jgi:hypothetical protein
MLKHLINAIDIFRKGSCVADAVKAKNLSALVGATAVLLYSLARIAKDQGYDLGISYEAARDIATGIGAIAGLFVTFATSDKVGILPPKRQTDDPSERDVLGG